MTLTIHIFDDDETRLMPIDFHEETWIGTGKLWRDVPEYVGLAYQIQVQERIPQDVRSQTPSDKLSVLEFLGWELHTRWHRTQESEPFEYRKGFPMENRGKSAKIEYF
jgi:hypothetical protein